MIKLDGQIYGGYDTEHEEEFGTIQVMQCDKHARIDTDHDRVLHFGESSYCDVIGCDCQASKTAEYMLDEKETIDYSNKNVKRFPSFFDEYGNPKKVRVYDNGGDTIDRYTCVFTGTYRNKTSGQFLNLSCCDEPTHPMGVGSLGESDTQIDKPSYSHLGKKIAYTSLPNGAKNYILNNYKCLWHFEYEKQELI